MAEDDPAIRTTKGDVYIVIGLAVSSMLFAVLYSASSIQVLETPLWACCLASVLLAAPLLSRRRFPSQSAFAICLIYSVALVNSAMEIGVSQIILFMGIYSIGPWQRSRRVAFWSRLILCVGMAILFAVSLSIQYRTFGDLTILQFAASGGVSFLTNAAFFGGAWIFGNRAWKQRKLMAELRAANEEVREQGQQLTRQALDLERVRIARELHDGVAHHIAGVGIHAAAARRSLEKNPDKAKESLKTIEASTRETVDELRALVYTLRDTDTPADSRDDADDGEASTSNEQVMPSVKGNPGLGDLPELIASAQRFGQTVECTTIGQQRSLTPITEMSIYRVIQESLTNCSRYAGAGAEVDVRIRYGTSDLEVEVSDARGTESTAERSHGSTERSAGAAERSAGAVGRSEGTGLGIVGMRERMTALGGSLEAGPKSRGGWLVRARIPYPRSTAEGFGPRGEFPQAEGRGPAAPTATTPEPRGSEADVSQPAVPEPAERAHP